jgi:hypothetical protein
MLSYQETVNGLRAMGVPLEKAELTARRQCNDAPPPAPDPDAQDAWSEKRIEAEGDDMMRKLGFEVIRFSHPGKTQQTPGIPDRRYYRRPRMLELRDGRFLAPAITVWVEYKSATGEQRPGQKLFQELVEACGETYLLAGPGALETWLIAQRIAVRVGNELEPIPHDGLPF